MRVLTIFAIALSIAFAAAAADKETVQLKGWVSDAHCTTSHVGGKNPSCVKKCVKGGADIGHPEWEAQAMVLVEDETNKVIVIADAATLSGFDSKHVTITGQFDGEKFQVEKVDPIEPAEKP